MLSFEISKGQHEIFSIGKHYETIPAVECSTSRNDSSFLCHSLNFFASTFSLIFLSPSFSSWFLFFPLSSSLCFSSCSVVATPIRNLCRTPLSHSSPVNLF